jgi:hypothetical protein
MIGLMLESMESTIRKVPGLRVGVGPRQVVECNEEEVLEGTVYVLEMMFLATKMSS